MIVITVLQNLVNKVFVPLPQKRCATAIDNASLLHHLLVSRKLSAVFCT
jgi:hypothetical protein